MAPHRLKRFPLLKEHGLTANLSTMFSMPVSTPTRNSVLHKVAPDFVLADHHGQVHRLHDYIALGKPVIIFFYPLSGSPYCVKQNCGMRDMVLSAPAFSTASVTILAVSQDPPNRTDQFVEQHSLPYPVLSDNDRAVHDEWGVGSTLLGLMNKRMTFIIDRGIVRGCAEGLFNYRGHIRFVERWLARIASEDSFRSQGGAAAELVRGNYPDASGVLDRLRPSTRDAHESDPGLPWPAAVHAASRVADATPARGPDAVMRNALHTKRTGTPTSDQSNDPMAAQSSSPVATSPWGPQALAPEPPAYQNVDELSSTPTRSLSRGSSRTNHVTPTPPSSENEHIQSTYGTTAGRQQFLRPGDLAGETASNPATPRKHTSHKWSGTLLAPSANECLAQPPPSTQANQSVVRGRPRGRSRSQSLPRSLPYPSAQEENKTATSPEGFQAISTLNAYHETGSQVDLGTSPDPSLGSSQYGDQQPRSSRTDVDIIESSPSRSLGTNSSGLYSQSQLASPNRTQQSFASASREELSTGPTQVSPLLQPLRGMSVESLCIPSQESLHRLRVPVESTAKSNALLGQPPTPTSPKRQRDTAPTSGSPGLPASSAQPSSAGKVMGKIIETSPTSGQLRPSTPITDTQQTSDTRLPIPPHNTTRHSNALISPSSTRTTVFTPSPTGTRPRRTLVSVAAPSVRSASSTLADPYGTAQSCRTLRTTASTAFRTEAPSIASFGTKVSQGPSSSSDPTAHGLQSIKSCGSLVTDTFKPEHFRSRPRTRDANLGASRTRIASQGRSSPDEPPSSPSVGTLWRAAPPGSTPWPSNTQQVKNDPHDSSSPTSPTSSARSPVEKDLHRRA